METDEREPTNEGKYRKCAERCAPLSIQSVHRRCVRIENRYRGGYRVDRIQSVRSVESKNKSRVMLKTCTATNRWENKQMAVPVWRRLLPPPCVRPCGMLGRAAAAATGG